MILQIAIAVLAVMLAGAQHLLVMGKTYSAVQATIWPRWARFQGVLLAATLGQCIAALIFAVAYQLSHAAGLGGFEKVAFPPFLNLFSFSMVNLTTLGLGDLVPTVQLKFLAGIEAMTGFLLISCSASHVFQVMKND
ncbi:ion channel [Qipengyuania sp. CAU 1752]